MPNITISTDADAAAAALIKAGYTVLPPANVPPVTPVGSAPVLSVVFAQNGATPILPQDYTFAANDARADIADGGDGNAACIKVTVSAPWGGFQPSNNNGQVTDFSKCSNILVSLFAPKGTPFSMYYMMGSDTVINIAGSPQRLVKTKDGWERFVVPKAPMMTDVKLGDVSAVIYKGCVQLQTGATGVFLVDNWGGV